MSEIDYKAEAEQWMKRADGERRLAASLQKQLDAVEAEYEAEHTARLAAEQRVRELETSINKASWQMVYGSNAKAYDMLIKALLISEIVPHGGAEES